MKFVPILSHWSRTAIGIIVDWRRRHFNGGFRRHIYVLLLLPHIVRNNAIVRNRDSIWKNAHCTHASRSNGAELYTRYYFVRGENVIWTPRVRHILGRWRTVRPFSGKFPRQIEWKMLCVGLFFLAALIHLTCILFAEILDEGDGYRK